MRGMWWVLIPLWMFFFFYFRSRPRRWSRRSRHWGDFPDGADGPSREDPERREAEQRRKDEQIESLETRVAELESRLDFTERLLAQRREGQPNTNVLPGGA